MPTVTVIRTTKGTPERLSNLGTLTMYHESPAIGACVTLYPERTFQKWLGFGGAFTESAAVTLLKMSPKRQEEILQAYFNKNTGIGYRIGRVHINSCDFSLQNWACCEVDADTALENFTIERYRAAIIPMLRRAADISGEPLTLFASPWSPPAWMKDTKAMNHGGKLLPEYRQAWAMYYVRFIREMEKDGIPIWGLTVQNEPEAVQVWDSCVYTAEEERDFVRDYLGPALERHGLGHIKVIIWDHNRDRMFDRAKIAYDDPRAAAYIWGVGFHWYCDPKFDNVLRTHDLRPDKHLIFTEGCQESGPHLGEWRLGERYGESIINDLNAWTEAWTDWNLILDETGGPNHVNNLCSAPIIADTRTDEVLYQSSYYYMGQFSRYIRVGARRILGASSRDALETTAFQNPDGTIAVVVMNRQDSGMEFWLKHKCGAVKAEAPPRSISTFVIA